MASELTGLSLLPLFEPSQKVSFEDMQLHYYSLNLQDKYPFTDIFFKNLNHLKLLNTFAPIVKFTNWIRQEMDHRLKREDAKEIQIGEQFKKIMIKDKNEKFISKSFKEF